MSTRQWRGQPRVAPFDAVCYVCAARYTGAGRRRAGRRKAEGEEAYPTTAATQPSCPAVDPAWSCNYELRGQRGNLFSFYPFTAGQPLAQNGSSETAL